MNANDEEIVEETSEVDSDNQNEVLEEEESETSEESSEEVEEVEEVSGEVETVPETVVVENIDYSDKFDTITSLQFLTLGVLVAIGCIVAWVGAKRE